MINDDIGMNILIWYGLTEINFYHDSIQFDCFISLIEFDI